MRLDCALHGSTPWLLRRLANFALTVCLGADTADTDTNKRRLDAIEALTKIEIEFATLRDALYVEKMEEVARERWQIESGALGFLCPYRLAQQIRS